MKTIDCEIYAEIRIKVDFAMHISSILLYIKKFWLENLIWISFIHALIKNKRMQNSYRFQSVE